jgi:hypothetical protein
VPGPLGADCPPPIIFPVLEIDTSKAHPARMYDYLLGGKEISKRTVRPSPRS